MRSPSGGSHAFAVRITHPPIHPYNPPSGGSRGLRRQGARLSARRQDHPYTHPPIQSPIRGSPVGSRHWGHVSGRKSRFKPYVTLSGVRRTESKGLCVTKGTTPGIEHRNRGRRASGGAFPRRAWERVLVRKYCMVGATGRMCLACVWIQNKPIHAISYLWNCHPELVSGSRLRRRC